MTDDRPRTPGPLGASAALVEWRARRRVQAAGAGLLLAAVPVLAQAAAEEGRALEPSDNFGTVALVTLLATGSVLLLATLGRLYQRQRGIRWRFQDPDSPHEGGH